jgi:putative ABC transport system permease protein
MGKIMYMMMAMAIPIYLILVYLLTKTVIDRSARSISYMKVFGYRNREVNKLYLASISGMVIASLLLSLPLIIYVLTGLLYIVFMDYNGFFEIVVPFDRMALEVGVGLLCYAIVAFLHVRRIKRVPLSLALKVQE